ncbi:MAG: DnaT-like ssDNA-binding protein [Nocardioides sp.]|jgi:hypothetical protein
MTAVTPILTPESARDCFLSVADADLIAEKIPGEDGAAWRALTDADEKARLLIQASRDLSEETWDGVEFDADQALAWPRRPPYNRSQLVETDIPEEVKRATVWQAIFYVTDRIRDQKAMRDGIRDTRVGNVSVTFRSSGDLICEEAHRCLDKKWLLAGIGVR